MTALAFAGAMAVGLAATPAAAVTFTTFSFTGYCDDCRAQSLADHGLTGFTDEQVAAFNPAYLEEFLGRGTLVLKDYAPGDQTAANFVSFDYSSYLITYSVNQMNLAEFGADFSMLPGPATVHLLRLEGTGPGDRELFTSPGNWFIGPGGTGCITGCGDADRGTTYTWSALANSGGAVPEPMSWALMILGFGLAGAKLRAGRRSVA